MPGSTVAALRSMTRAPAGMATEGPTSVIRSPVMSTTWFGSIVPDRLSNRRPARIATTCAGDARNLAGALAMPPAAHGRGEPHGRDEDADDYADARRTTTHAVSLAFDRFERSAQLL